MGNEKKVKVPGRRPKLRNKKKLEKLLQALREGAPVRLACQVAGIDESTYYRYLEKAKQPRQPYYANFASVARRAIAQGEYVLMRRIRDGSIFDTGDAKWLLERRWPKEWGRKDELAVSVEAHITQEMAIEINETMLVIAHLDKTIDWSQLQKPVVRRIAEGGRVIEQTEAPG